MPYQFPLWKVKKTIQEKRNVIHNDSSLINNTQPPSYDDAAVQVDTTDLDVLFKKKERKVFKIDSVEQLTAWTGLGSFKMLEVIVSAFEMTPEAKQFSKLVISIKHLVILVFVKIKTNMSFRCISSLFDIG